MSYAESTLDFALWVQENGISPTKFNRMAYKCKKNLEKEVGETLYCPYCHKKVVKTELFQFTCGKEKCEKKLKPYRHRVSVLSANPFITACKVVNGKTVFYQPEYYKELLREKRELIEKEKK